MNRWTQLLAFALPEAVFCESRPLEHLAPGQYV